MNPTADEKPFSASALVAGKFVDWLGVGLIPWGVLPQCSSWSLMLAPAGPSPSDEWFFVTSVAFVPADPS